jgi:transaldolase
LTAIVSETTVSRATFPPTSSNLRLMLDSADVNQWAQWLPTGLLYGVTTNPLLLERSQVPCRTTSLGALTEKALSLGAQEVQLQAWGGTVETYFETGMALAGFDRRVVVKVPIVVAGVTAATRLIRQGCRVTLTGVYAVPQVILAAAIGAEYAAPYLGRIHETGRDGCAEAIAMQRSLDGLCSSTRLLVASLRRVEDIATLTAQGLNTFTISQELIDRFFDIPDTLRATEDFERAARSLQLKNLVEG